LALEKVSFVPTLDHSIIIVGMPASQGVSEWKTYYHSSVLDLAFQRRTGRVISYKIVLTEGTSWDLKQLHPHPAPNDKGILMSIWC
jgi:hypothetical protein